MRRKAKQKMDEGLRLAIKAAGTKYRLAKLLGMTPQALQKWRHVPFRRVLQVEQVTGVDRTKLRPELFKR